MMTARRLRDFSRECAVIVLAVMLCLSPATQAAGPGGGGRGGGGGTTVTAAYVPGANGLSPSDSSWGAASAATVTLVRYIDYVSNADTNDTMCMMLGSAINRAVTVKAVHNGSDIFFRYEWSDSTADSTVSDTPKFADAFAMEIPYSGSSGTNLAMGTQSGPVNIVFWRADLSQPQNIVAGGIGTPQPSPDAQNLIHYQSWGSGRWTVIVSRPLTGASVNQVTLARGASYRAAFANWNGSALDRNGRKAISGWGTLAIQ
ncbi:MAG: ethylbenzene dehydrogenase-related protein [Sulfuricaulis sp.]|uniref:ethylbenzene dehydrogenase-related protein n=1 Tax=Sulfuricaulis sp. TaxID=2003553 RepID=UPI0025F02E8E|nr:ethylbenzene dehydrogenase-related protein [Sulfuricaulis sp.]MCR4346643.1 ethylbenzene dehydrogenase-related protein [Sulfuricaulis sp.]